MREKKELVPLSNMTEWFPLSVEPTEVGDYNVSSLGLRTSMRFWNGRTWSRVFAVTGSETYKALCRGMRGSKAALAKSVWRGLKVPYEA